LRQELIAQRVKSAKEKQRNDSGGEMARVMNHIPFIMTVATKGHATAH
jgi:hypothetical protein